MLTTTDMSARKTLAWARCKKIGQRNSSEGVRGFRLLDRNDWLGVMEENTGTGRDGMGWDEMRLT